MTFQIIEREDGTLEWYLAKTTKVVARSANYFSTEQAARSDIHEAKTAMKGARFAEVVKV